METLNLNLLETMNLKSVCYDTALQQFYCGKDVYAKITDTLWIQTHNKLDGSFELNKNLEFYVQNGYDEDKLIVTRHDVIEDFFRKENAWDKYRLFVTYLTFHSNEELFFHDAGLWRQNIKKVRWDLWKIRKCFRSNRLVKFYTVGFGGFIGKLIWRQCWKR